MDWFGPTPPQYNIRQKWTINPFKLFMPIKTSSKCSLILASKFVMTALPIFRRLICVSRSVTWPPAVLDLTAAPTGRRAASASLAGMVVLVAPVSIKKGMGMSLISTVPR